MLWRICSQPSPGIHAGPDRLPVGVLGSPRATALTFVVTQIWGAGCQKGKGKRWGHRPIIPLYQPVERGQHLREQCGAWLLTSHEDRVHALRLYLGGFTILPKSQKFPSLYQDETSVLRQLWRSSNLEVIRTLTWKTETHAVSPDFASFESDIWTCQRPRRTDALFSSP